MVTMLLCLDLVNRYSHSRGLASCEAVTSHHNCCGGTYAAADMSYHFVLVISIP